MNRHHFLIVLLSTASVLPLACGGGDSPGPIDPGPGDGSVVLLDTSHPSEWTCFSSMDCRRCKVTNGGFTTNDSTQLVNHGYPLGLECASLNGDCWWQSTRRIDFRLYASARLQFEVTASRLYQVTGGPHDLRVEVEFWSNVPGTPGLSAVNEALGTPTAPIAQWRRSFDISLENALHYSEATVAVHLRCVHQTSPSPSSSECLGASEAYIHDFKIVGRP